MLRRVATRVRGAQHIPSKKAAAKKAHKATQPDMRQGPSDANGLAPLVAAHDSRVEGGRVADGLLHVSSVIKECPRMLALMLKRGEVHTSVRSADRVLWAMGRAAENHIRTALIEVLGADRVIGKWSCRCGHSTITGMGVKNWTCPSCNGPVNSYGELDLVDGDRRLGGNPDFLYITDAGRVRVVEIKSKKKTGPDGFDNLVAPEQDHCMQMASYHRMIMHGASNHLLGRSIDPMGTVFYVCKDYAFAGSPYKEFIVDPSSLDNPLGMVFQSASDIAAYLRGQAPPPPRLAQCSTIQSTTARNCPACVHCFSI